MKSIIFIFFILISVNVFAIDSYKGLIFGKSIDFNIKVLKKMGCNNHDAAQISGGVFYYVYNKCFRLGGQYVDTVIMFNGPEKLHAIILDAGVLNTTKLNKYHAALEKKYGKLISKPTKQEVLDYEAGVTAALQNLYGDGSVSIFIEKQVNELTKKKESHLKLMYLGKAVKKKPQSLNDDV